MAKCARHPRRETEHLCMKDSVYMCDECLKCRHPNDYCKFRDSCVVWYTVNIEGKKTNQKPKYKDIQL